MLALTTVAAAVVGVCGGTGAGGATGGCGGGVDEVGEMLPSLCVSSSETDSDDGVTWWKADSLPTSC